MEHPDTLEERVGGVQPISIVLNVRKEGQKGTAKLANAVYASPLQYLESLNCGCFRRFISIIFID